MITFAIYLFMQAEMFKTNSPFCQLLVKSAFVLNVIIYLQLIFTWSDLSVYLPYAMWLLFAAAVLYQLRFRTDRSFESSRGFCLFLLAAALVCAGVQYGVFRVQQQQDFAKLDPLDLPLPLRDGRYAISNGGISASTNGHHEAELEKYAVDIVKIGGLGRAHQGLWPSNDRDYLVYGQPIYAPCAGEVLDFSLAFSENTFRVKGTRIPASGNYLIVYCPSLDVSIEYAHLQKEPPRLQIGDSVTEDTIIGLVGNTGNSSRPHLHMQANKGRTMAYGAEGESVPFKLAGKLPLRNQLYFP